VVLPGETLDQIAGKHSTSVNKLKKLNRIPKSSFRIYEGQKLYLRKKKPAQEQMILLTLDQHHAPERAKASTVQLLPADPKEKADAPKPKVEANSTAPDPKVISPVREREMPVEPPVEAPVEKSTSSLEDLANDLSGKRQWITHIVAPGETLWQISQRYDTKVEIIKLINKLESSNISNGQTLRILAKPDTLGAN
ncbi:MAG: LysM peptidoglycan-binding domain-containing protein, partial [Bacteroidota bacterium]